MISRSYPKRRSQLSWKTRLWFGVGALAIFGLIIVLSTDRNTAEAIPRGSDDAALSLQVGKSPDETENPGSQLKESDIADRTAGQANDDWKTYWETSSHVAFRYPPQMSLRFEPASNRIVFAQDDDAFLFQLTYHLRYASQAYHLFEGQGARMETFQVLRIGTRLYASVQLPKEEDCEREAYLVPRPNGNKSIVLTFRICNGGALLDQRDTILGNLGFPNPPEYETWETAGLKSLGLKFSYPKAFGTLTSDAQGVYHWIERLSLTARPIETFEERSGTCNGQACEQVKKSGGLVTFLTTDGELKGFIKLPEVHEVTALELTETAGTRGLLRRMLESVGPR